MNLFGRFSWNEYKLEEMVAKHITCVVMNQNPATLHWTPLYTNTCAVKDLFLFVYGCPKWQAKPEAYWDTTRADPRPLVVSVEVLATMVSS